MELVFIPTAKIICKVNQLICRREEKLYRCYHPQKLEKMIAFAMQSLRGPISKKKICHAAGKLCFSLVKNPLFFSFNLRTSAVVSLSFLHIHQIHLEQKCSEYVEMILKISQCQINRENFLEWIEKSTIFVQ